MKFLSVCSGIEAASVAWESLGWKAVAFAEIEPFPAAVLAHHYPDVPNFGDMTQLPDLLRAGVVDLPDLLCGGTPCQAFSVAGLRKSLSDARGNLSLTFCEIANAIDDERAAAGLEPGIIFWENVPGVLSTADNAFGCFLAALAGESEPLVAPGGKWTNAGAVFGPQRAVAWRILDAQYFGVAQRRRRVFVVASARDDFDPAAVLFEFDGVRRDTPPSREAGQAAAGGAARSVALRGREGGATAELGDELAGCLRASGGGGDKPHTLAPVITMAHGQGGAEIGFDRGPCLTCNHEAPIAAYGIRTANTSSNGWGIQEEATHTLDEGQTPVVTHSLRGEGFDASEDGTGRGTPLVPVSFHPTQDPISSTEVCHSIGANDNATAAVAVQASQSGVRINDTIGTLDANYGSRRHNGVMQAMQVRRLTPVECERLQGFPDGYTAIPWRKKPASECPDGPRYKALGNSWAVPNVRWIGQRIDLHLMGLL